MNQHYNIFVNGKHRFNMDADSIDQLDIVCEPSGQYHLLYKSRSYLIRVSESDLNSKAYTLSIDDREYRIEINDQLDQLINDMGLKQRQTQQIQSIKAPMPGMILDLMVNEAQEVQEDDPLLILEAMKMENVIKSPRTGKIAAIHVKTGQAIDKNALLIEFE